MASLFVVQMNSAHFCRYIFSSFLLNSAALDMTGQIVCPLLTPKYKKKNMVTIQRSYAMLNTKEHRVFRLACQLC
jgi:hypothetical protein